MAVLKHVSGGFYGKSFSSKNRGFAILQDLVVHKYAIVVFLKVRLQRRCIKVLTMRCHNVCRKIRKLPE